MRDANWLDRALVHLATLDVPKDVRANTERLLRALAEADIKPGRIVRESQCIALWFGEQFYIEVDEDSYFGLLRSVKDTTSAREIVAWLDKTAWKNR